MVTLLRTVNVKVSKAFYYVSSRPSKVSTSQPSHTSACVAGERLVSRNSGFGVQALPSRFFRQEKKVLHATKASFRSGLVCLISSYPPLPSLATPLD